MPQDQIPAPEPAPTLVRLFQRARQFLSDYFWLVIRNIIGWILMLASLPIGIALPGPLGLPMFLIGFALVTFPGKRRLTARVLRGRRLELEHAYYTAFAALVAILIPAIVLWILATTYEVEIRALVQEYAPQRVVFIIAPIILIAVVWLVTRISLSVLNLLLRNLPVLRRRIRPWLRRRGFKLLPPRGKRPSDEILEIDPSYRRNLTWFWGLIRSWMWRLAGVAVAVLILGMMVRRVLVSWDEEVHARVMATGAVRFLVAAGMFALFLFFFRALIWRRIMKGFGHRLTVSVATRIWSLSELARYLPGSIWQLVGRMYFCRRYGISGSVCSATQVLELAVFLLANLLVAVTCLLFLGTKTLGDAARPWLFVAMALVPVMIAVLHPRVFYGTTNAVLKWLDKPLIEQRLRSRKLIEILVLSVIGLLWQSLAVWMLLEPALALPIQKWWVVAGAYSLAWCAGFLVVWAPAGLGVREIVFVATLMVALPTAVRRQFLDSPETLTALLLFLSLLLRLWTMAGELMLAVVAASFDYRGVLGMSPPNATTAEQAAALPGAAPRSSNTSRGGIPPTFPAGSSGG